MSLTFHKFSLFTSITLYYVPFVHSCWLFTQPLIPFEVVDACRSMVPNLDQEKVQTLSLNPLLAAKTYEDKCFIACTAELLQVLDKDGNILVDQMRANGYRTVFVPSSTPTQIEQRVEACSLLKAENLCETGYQQLRCLADS